MNMPPNPWQPPSQGKPRFDGPPVQSQPSFGGQPGYLQAQWPPPPKNNTTKWLLIAVVILLVAGVAIGGTLLFTRGSDGGKTNPSQASEATTFASSDDVGPVSIISTEPTCADYTGLNNAIASVQNNGWGEGRGNLGPASEWTASQRDQVDAVRVALNNSFEQIGNLARQTPHRVVRELYQQFIAYGRAYVNGLPNYVPADNNLASVNVSTGAALMSLCDAITYGATNRSLAVEVPASPSSVASVVDSKEPERFLVDRSSVCGSWTERNNQFNAETADWQALDSNLERAQWTPEQSAIHMAALPKLTAYARDIESFGLKSGNPTFADFSSTAALYIRAYVSAGDSYVKADSFLISAAFRLGNTITAACRAVSD